MEFVSILMSYVRGAYGQINPLLNYGRWIVWPFWVWYFQHDDVAMFDSSTG